MGPGLPNEKEIQCAQGPFPISTKRWGPTSPDYGWIQRANAGVILEEGKADGLPGQANQTIHTLAECSREHIQRSQERHWPEGSKNKIPCKALGPLPGIRSLHLLKHCLG